MQVPVDVASDPGTQAEASHTLALRAAAGDGVPMDFPGALEHLERAAALGHGLAQQELAALASRFDLVRELAAGRRLPASRWSELRAAIDIAALLQTPPFRILSPDPRVGLVENFASADVCNWLIGRALPRIRPAKVFDPASGMGTYAHVRTNSECQFRTVDSDLVLLVLRARIATVTELPVAAMEATTILHYIVGQEFQPHHDYFDIANPGYAKEVAAGGQRVLTFLLCLNDDYEGGETQFPVLGKRFKGRRGNALFFWNVTPNGIPDPRTLHAGLPPTQGEKWLLSQWVREQVFRLPAA